MKRRRVARAAQPQKRLDAVEDELEARIRMIRADYDGKPKSSAISAASLIGPDMVGVHLVASETLVQLLAKQAIGEARGSSQSLLHIEGSTSADVDVWVPAESWKRPNIWLRQGKSSIEADWSCLNHWVQSLLSPESRSIEGRLTLFCPRRTDNNDMDDQVAVELQSMFEVMGFGLLKTTKSVTFEVDITSWDETCRNLSRAMEDWEEGRRKDNSPTSLIPTLWLVVWPNEGWHRTRSALAAAASYVSNKQVSLQIIPEDLVLLNRRRKSRLIALASGVYSMMSDGAAFVMLPEPASPEAVSASSVTSSSPTERAARRTHVAFSASRDARWVTYAWCGARGESLSVRAMPMPMQNSFARAEDWMKTKNEVMLKCLEHVATETKDSNFIIVSHGQADDFIDMDFFRTSISHTLYWCDVQHSTAFKCTSIMEDGEENDTIRNDLDDLAFLSTVSEAPSRGAVRNVLLGTLCQSEPSLFSAPAHLRCAHLLAKYLEGLIPHPALLETSI